MANDLAETRLLLTLTGPGGVGKTRFGLQAAAELSDRFADGVFFVNLAPVRDPALVVPTIAEILDIREGSGQPVLEHVKQELQQKHMFLLLDNFEQVVSAGVQLVDVLAACPHLKILRGLARVVAVQGELTWAVRLWGAAETLRETTGAPISHVERPAYESSVTAARAQLGEQPFAAAWAEGRLMKPEQALAAREPVRNEREHEDG